MEMAGQDITKLDTIIEYPITRVLMQLAYNNDLSKLKR
jgi:hypothetical protein